jgi:hypothetical protein
MTTLHTLLAAADAARTGARGDDEPTLLDTLANDYDGAAPIAALLAQFSEATIVATATADPGDKRKGPRIKVATIAEEPTAWLTASGWSKAGHASRRERVPSSRGVEHARAPRDVAAWLRTTVAPRSGVEFLEMDARQRRQWVEASISTAWGQVRAGGAAGDDAGKLLGGVYPDALTVEHWPRAQLERRAAMYPDLPTTHDLSIRIAWEFEFSAKGLAMLGHKVAQHSRCLALGWWHLVVWVPGTAEVARHLAQHLDDASLSHRTQHYVADPPDVGLRIPGGFVRTTWPWAVQPTAKRTDDLASLFD